MSKTCARVGLSFNTILSIATYNQDPINIDMPLTGSFPTGKRTLRCKLSFLPFLFFFLSLDTPITNRSLISLPLLASLSFRNHPNLIECLPSTKQTSTLPTFHNSTAFSVHFHLLRCQPFARRPAKMTSLWEGLDESLDMPMNELLLDLTAAYQDYPTFASDIEGPLGSRLSIITSACGLLPLSCPPSSAQPPCVSTCSRSYDSSTPVRSQISLLITPCPSLASQSFRHYATSSTSTLPSSLTAPLSHVSSISQSATPSTKPAMSRTRRPLRYPSPPQLSRA